jgi:uncharacterized membrane protein
MFCPDCGKEIPAGSKFCPACGKAAGTVPNAPNTASGPAVPQADANDAEKNKGMAILAYILFFIPLLTGDHKTSPFVKYHTNQAIVLWLAAIAVFIAFTVLISIFAFVLPWALWRIIRIIFYLIRYAPLVLGILGIINAANGQMKPLPLIGKFTILK